MEIHILHNKLHKKIFTELSYERPAEPRRVSIIEAISLSCVRS